MVIGGLAYAFGGVSLSVGSERFHRIPNLVCHVRPFGFLCFNAVSERRPVQPMRSLCL